MTDQPAPSALPFNALPWPVWVWVLAILGIEAVLWAGGVGLIGGPRAVGWRVSAFEDYAFSSALQAFMLDSGHTPLTHLKRYLTFPFVHGSPLQALLTAVLIAALGKSLAEAMGKPALLVLLVLVPIPAAVVFGLVVGQGSLGWLFGAMVPVFALVGAFTWLKWHQAAGDPVKRRRAFSLIIVLVLARLGFGLFAELGPAWIAELTAFALAFALAAAVLGPGQWRALRARLQQRG